MYAFTDICNFFKHEKQDAWSRPFVIKPNISVSLGQSLQILWMKGHPKQVVADAKTWPFLEHCWGAVKKMLGQFFTHLTRAVGVAGTAGLSCLGPEAYEKPTSMIADFRGLIWCSRWQESLEESWKVSCRWKMHLGTSAWVMELQCTLPESLRVYKQTAFPVWGMLLTAAEIGTE